MPARAALLRWYEPRRRAYPWRARPTPFRVLVSEVMLQQTQAPRVEPVFRAFVRRWPSIRALAGATRAEVVTAWSGLGYNRRAVALHRAARIIVAEHAGRVPRSEVELRRLPGIGPYTAAAVASIAFGEPVPLVDTNVRRVLARAELGVDTVDAAPADVEAVARRVLDGRDPGSWNQALMDLGREVCRPRPRCGECPLARGCRFLRDGGVPKTSPNRQPSFEGSMRQVRGAVVRALTRGPATIERLAAVTGLPAGRVVEAVRALARDGLIDAGPVALAGGPRGRVRLSP